VRIVGARENNLKNITAEIPLGRMVVITGVSGSGKSSLVTNTLFPALSQRDMQIAARVLKEVNANHGFLLHVGLD